MSHEFLLQMQDVSKTFPGVRALSGVNLEVRPGTVHALMGENGAGKSTLMKILIGMYQADPGATIILDGTPATIPDTAAGLGLGISMIHQELSPVPEMTVAENIFLGREPVARFGLVSRKQMVSACRELFNRWEIDIDPRARMRTLSIAQTQMVEIAANGLRRNTVFFGKLGDRYSPGFIQLIKDQLVTLFCVHSTPIQLMCICAHERPIKVRKSRHDSHLPYSGSIILDPPLVQTLHHNSRNPHRFSM